MNACTNRIPAPGGSIRASGTYSTVHLQEIS
jgi:hypothetical protein